MRNTINVFAVHDANCQFPFFLPKQQHVDIDECANSSICWENSVCVNSLGSYACQCLDGYTGLQECKGQ